MSNFYEQQQEELEQRTTGRSLTKTPDMHKGTHYGYFLLVDGETEQERHHFSRYVAQTAYGNETQLSNKDKALIRVIIVGSTDVARLEGGMVNSNRVSAMLLTLPTFKDLYDNVIMSPFAETPFEDSWVDEDGTFHAGTPFALVNTKVDKKNSFTFTRISPKVFPKGTVIPETVELYEDTIDQQAAALSAYNLKKVDPAPEPDVWAGYGVEPEAAPDKAF